MRINEMTNFLPVMSLQRIFSSTTIIVGLFISVDYGLCDEFRCRGREVPGHAATARSFWGAKAAWTLVYVGALAIFSMYFTLLERHYTTEVNNDRFRYSLNIWAILTQIPYVFSASKYVSIAVESAKFFSLHGVSVGLVERHTEERFGRGRG